MLAKIHEAYKQQGITAVLANYLCRRPVPRARLPIGQVLLTHEEANEHDQTNLEELKKKEPQFVAWVESVLDHARRQYLY